MGEPTGQQQANDGDDREEQPRAGSRIDKETIQVLVCETQRVTQTGIERVADGAAVAAAIVRHVIRHASLSVIKI